LPKALDWRELRGQLLKPLKPRVRLLSTWRYLAISSGFIDTALVVGVEKYTDVVGPRAEALVSQSTDYDYEGVQGITPAAQAGLLMQRYLYEYGVPRSVFAEFPLLAHANAVHNPNAMFRRAHSPRGV
jgi:acetyl-CoA C-acetyltransferase